MDRYNYLHIKEFINRNSEACEQSVCVFGTQEIFLKIFIQHINTQTFTDI